MSGYIPVDKPWSWATGTPRERGVAIRNHLFRLSHEQVADLFQLTPEGVATIARGFDWHERFAREPKP